MLVGLLSPCPPEQQHVKGRGRDMFAVFTPSRWRRSWQQGSDEEEEVRREVRRENEALRREEERRRQEEEKKLWKRMEQRIFMMK